MGLLFFLPYHENYLNFTLSPKYEIHQKNTPLCSKSLLYCKYGICCMDVIFWPKRFFQQRERATELKKVEDAKKYYQKEIERTQKQLDNIQNNKAAIEKYARERYLLRREGEEVYLFEDTLHPATK